MNKSCIPVKFLILECITWLFVLFPVVFMFLDFFYCWTKLSALAYLFASLCGLALFVTTKIAKKNGLLKTKEIVTNIVKWKIPICLTLK